MSNTTALTAEFRKVIAGKFVTQRNGGAMHCVTCGTVLVLGATFAATNNDGWQSYCADCADSTAHQIRGLVAKLTEMGVTIDGPARDAAVAFLTNESYATFVAAKCALMNVRTEVGKAHAEAAKAERIAGLADDENYTGLALFVQYCSDRDGEFASSLLGQWETKGRLSDRQMVYVVKFAARGTKLAAAAEPDPTVAPGLYTDGTIVTRIYERQHRLLARSFNGTVFTSDMRGVKRVFAGLTDGTVRLLTGDEARAYGRQNHRCFNCLSIGRPGELSDDRSIAAGYGERCADVNGWWYPTAEEAAHILRGDCQH